MLDARRLLAFALLPLVVATAAPAAAQPTPAAADAATPPSPAPAASAVGPALRAIGFRQGDGYDEIFVQHDGALEPSVRLARDGVLSLLLPRAHVPRRNDLRPLDTRFFHGPIRHAVLRPIEGEAQAVQLDLELADAAAPFRLLREGRVLRVRVFARARGTGRAL